MTRFPLLHVQTCRYAKHADAEYEEPVAGWLFPTLYRSEKAVYLTVALKSSGSAWRAP